MARRRRSGSSRSRARRPRFLARWLVYANVAVALLLGGWYFVQPENRQTEVRRLVGAAFDRGRNVSPLEVAWDIWQLYYANPASARIPAGDKTHVYGGEPIATPGSRAALLRTLVNRGYVVGYDDARGNPAWAAYRVKDIAKTGEPPPRPEKFSVDRRTVARVTPDSYTGSGYDRGHMAPNYAIATRYGAAAQEETFLMSNITPQKHSLNAGLWKELELKIATNYATRYEEVWVLTGPIFGERPQALRGGVQIPEAFFLIVVDEHEGRLRTLSFIIPQDAPASARAGDFLVSIDEIERRTQLDFLSALEDAAEEQFESQTPSRVW
ncbi:MAG: DNA/RNA non-specific endonuclease [Opitutus sp.]|nr:DNA/RNA non-specific endonuclease [Opitutus sp.]